MASVAASDETLQIKSQGRFCCSGHMAMFAAYHTVRRNCLSLPLHVCALPEMAYSNAQKGSVLKVSVSLHWSLPVAFASIVASKLHTAVIR
jgi:hypothetical protein